MAETTVAMASETEAVVVVQQQQIQKRWRMAATETEAAICGNKETAEPAAE